MGNRVGNLFGSFSEKDSGDSSKMKRYYLSDPSKICYAVLLGDNHSPDGKTKLKSVRNDLILMEETFNECGVYAMRAFKELTFDRSEYEALCEQLVGMESKLAGYSCYLFYYSGHGNHEGILVGQNEVIRYSDIVDRVGMLMKGSKKPRIFIFDCCREKCCNLVIEGSDLKERISHKPQEYLPDTLVCFSTLDYSTALGTQKGSAFTIEFCEALKRFRQYLPLPEIITQASGRARALISRQYLENNQIKDLPQPACYNFLNAALFLSDSVSNTFRDNIEYNPELELKQWFDQKKNWERKGVGEEQSCEDDSIGKKSKVSIIYAPDLCEVEGSINKLCVLANALTDLGFIVYLDVWKAGEKKELRSWHDWYTRSIAQSDHVLVACSPALSVAYQQVNPTEGRLYILSQVWSMVCTEMGKGMIHKFYPVVLHEESANCIPSVFGGTVYSIIDDIPQEFNRHEIKTDYDKLVIHMAGLEIKQPLVGAVQQLKAKQVSPLDLPKDLRDLYTSRKGHKNVSQAPVQRMPVSYIPSQQIHVPHVQQPFQMPLHQNPNPPYSHQGIPSNTFQYHQGAPSGMVQYHQNPPYNSPQYHQGNPYNPSHYHQAAPTNPPSRPRVLPPLVANKHVDSQVIYWLSQNMVRWKFVGRELGIEDAAIERIDYNYSRDLGEQCYQVLNEWTRRTPEKLATYSALLRALQLNEKEDLCRQFMGQVMMVESSQDSS